MLTGCLFADVIRSLRKGKGMYLHDLAAKVQLSIPEMSAVERGVVRPTDAQAGAIGAALGLSAQLSCLLLDAHYGEFGGNDESV